MGTVRASIDIDASPAEVWAILSDIGGWDRWNELLVEGRCDGGLGSRVSVKVDAGPLFFPVRSRICEWEEGRTLAWGEHRGRIARIQHGFTLEPQGSGTRVVHYESFEGLVGRLIFPVIRSRLTKNYAAFLDALKARVEDGA